MREITKIRDSLNYIDNGIQFLEQCIQERKAVNYSFDNLYGLGVVNGLILAHSLITGEPPRFLDVVKDGALHKSIEDTLQKAPPLEQRYSSDSTT